MQCNALSYPHPLERLAFHVPARLKRLMTLHPASGDALRSPAHEDLLVLVGTRKDKDAFVTLFNYYAPRVKSYLLRHGASDAAAEEIVQNTFITIWEKAATYSPQKAAASTWIFTIARNKRIDALRRDKFLFVDSDNAALELASDTAEESYTNADDIAQLETAIRELPDEQRRLLRMAFFEDKTHQKIAEETRLPLGTVKSRLRLALAKLKTMLKRDLRGDLS